jgi:hypothetical protein
LEILYSNSENIGELVDNIFVLLDKHRVSELVINIGDASRQFKTDKYHCETAYDKYRKNEAINTDEKYSLIYGIIYMFISKKYNRKIQLNFIFDKPSSAFIFVESIEKSFSDICLSSIMGIGFSDTFQEKNIAEYFYSANKKQCLFPVYICYDDIPDTELLTSLLRLKKIFPLEYVTFICKDEKASKTLSAILELLRILSDK